jgi:hypothetical protein
MFEKREKGAPLSGFQTKEVHYIPPENNIAY